MSMNFKILMILLALFIGGCMGTISNPVTLPDDDCEEEVVPASPAAAKNAPVDYTRTAADYRQYGERTPRDKNIVRTGAGSNMSASIPPSVDDEVEAYEETIVEDEVVEEKFDARNSEDPVEDWLAEEGQTLKGLLTEWSDRAGWRLVWKTNRNYPLTAGAMFRGRFADASAALIRTFARAKPAPVATYYKGNRVLVVETMEDENAFE